jgi:hypothetical protein
VYGVLDAGIKYAHIVIAGQKRTETFDFALPVPGPKFVGTDIGADTLYPGKKIEDLDLGSLRTTFAKQVCCTSNAEGTRNGDPLNLVIIEGRQSPIVPFISRGWHLARQLDFGSSIETARAFIFRDEFLTSPGESAVRLQSQGRLRFAKGPIHDKRTRSCTVLAYAIHL